LRSSCLRAGVGGVPRVPGAGGDSATGDLAVMMASMGIETAADQPKLLALRGQVAGRLAREQTHDALWRAGLPQTFSDPSTARAAAAAS
jgi:hydroxymethylglutaryl-CoA lyase